MSKVPPLSADKAKETRLLLFLLVLLFPLLTVVLVGGLGFAIWMLQIIMGPPGASGSPL